MSYVPRSVPTQPGDDPDQVVAFGGRPVVAVRKSTRDELGRAVVDLGRIIELLEGTATPGTEATFERAKEIIGCLNM